MWRRAAARTTIFTTKPSYTYTYSTCHKKSFRRKDAVESSSSSSSSSSASFFSTSSSSSSASADKNQNYKRSGPWPAGGAVLAAVLAGTVSARYLYNHVLHYDDDQQQQQQGHHSSITYSPKRDSSKATVRIKHIPATPPKAISQNNATPSLHTKGSSSSNNSSNNAHQEGEQLLVVLLDAQQFAAFVEQQRVMLARAQENDRTCARETLHTELQHAFQDAHDHRVSLFADWYFAYSTTYKLLSRAMSSAVQHAVTFRKQQTLQQRVSEDLQDYIRDKYLSIVLRPALMDPKIHRAFVKSFEVAHQNYQTTLQQTLDQSVQQFVTDQAEPYLAAPPSASDVTVDLDWTAQLQKVQHVPMQYEKFPERTVVLVASGAAAGKLAGGATFGAAVKAMTAKLAAPFATKAAASALGGKAAAGAAAAAAGSASGAAAMILAGPLGGAVGAAAGAALGIGVDMGVNAGISLLQRSTLEEDLHGSLDATLLEWEERLWPELLQVQNTWYSHAKEILKTPATTTATTTTTTTS